MLDILTSKLKIQSPEFAAIIECIPDAIYVGNHEGITIANKKALDMLGFDSVEELNQNIPILADKIKTRDLKTGKRLRTEEEPFYRAFLGETNEREVLTTHIKSGKEVIVRCSAAPVIYENTIIAAIDINSDITEKIKTKKELEKANKQLQIQNEELDKFVYHTSHDLKAPLFSIGSLLEFVKEENKNILTEEAIGMLDMATNKVNDMNEFIHSLLDSATTLKKSKECVDLNKVVRRVIENLNVAENMNVFIKHNLPIVKYHKISIAQVFQNLLSNAVKYMDKENGTITIGCSENANEFVISIQDNGTGIEENNLNKIFRKFHIGHSNPGKDSSGIGLSIVRDIVEESNGKVWVESVVGEGSTFYFSIQKN